MRIGPTGSQSERARQEREREREREKIDLGKAAERLKESYIGRSAQRGKRERSCKDVATKEEYGGKHALSPARDMFTIKINACTKFLQNGVLCGSLTGALSHLKLSQLDPNTAPLSFSVLCAKRPL